MTIAIGTTGLFVPVPEVPAHVDRMRAAHDPAASRGLAAHVTVLFPFRSSATLQTADLDALAALSRAVRSRRVRFEQTGRFPGVLYLRPNPASWFVDFTEAVMARWPEALPYDGAFDAVVPHLTVAIDEDEARLDELEREAAASLPFESAVTEAQLVVYDGEKWLPHTRFPFGAPAL